MATVKAKPKDGAEVSEEQTLLWPEGWERTRVTAYQKRPQWKLPREKYKAGLVRELELMGAASILITRAANERDPGVAVWFSRARAPEEWQDLLGIDSPLPTLDEIDKAFKIKARSVHPDNQDGGDIVLFQKFDAARKAAKDYVLGKHAQRHEFVMALDLFSESRWNMNAIRLAFNSLRRLQSLGMPSVLERTIQKTFKAALPMNAGEGQK